MLNLVSQSIASIVLLIGTRLSSQVLIGLVAHLHIVVDDVYVDVILQLHVAVYINVQVLPSLYQP